MRSIMERKKTSYSRKAINEIVQGGARNKIMFQIFRLLSFLDFARLELFKNFISLIFSYKIR